VLPATVFLKIGTTRLALDMLDEDEMPPVVLQDAVTSLRLLSRTLTPTRDQIRASIAGNLCRCTGYQQIVDAVEMAAAGRRKEQATADNQSLARAEAAGEAANG
jgi:hypothetical protein